MLLSIDPRKIDEQVANSPPPYVVFAYNLESPIVPPHGEIATTHVISTASGMPPDVERYRDRVLSLRQHIIDRGERPASSPEELEHIIDETRGR